MEDKLLIGEMLDNKMKGAEIARQTGLKPTTISTIKKNKGLVLQAIENSGYKDLKTRKRIKQVTHPEMEKALYLWFLQEREKNMVVFNKLLATQAKVFHSQLCQIESCKFSASDNWLNCFKHRRGLRYLKICGEQLSADKRHIEFFKEKVKQIIGDMQLSIHQIYNMDETALYYKLLPSKTLVTHEEKKASGHKVKKERITIMPCCNVTGSNKLPLQIIGTSKKPRFSKSQSPKEHRLHSHKEGLANTTIFS